MSHKKAKIKRPKHQWNTLFIWKKRKWYFNFVMLFDVF